MSSPTERYPIGTPGVAWNATDKTTWRSRQRKLRSYADDVTAVVDGLRSRFDVREYGRLDYSPDDIYPLWAIRSATWHDELPAVLVTGGVHGYETSGVLGALRFAEHEAAQYTDTVNLLIAPCVSPWAYERIHRWNPEAIDPNRAFRENSDAGESSALWNLVAPLRDRFLLHIDLHETTDTDESEFRPALAARDGKVHEPGEIPDGFYVVGDTDNPQIALQQAIIDGVSRVTHIAPADANGEIIGSPVVSQGVILYPFKALGLCAGVTNARYTSTTEVYPDSPRATPEQCVQAQLAAIRSAMDFAIGG